jgi:hypothetical protein
LETLRYAHIVPMSFGRVTSFFIEKTIYLIDLISRRHT